ncbi:hypothetical protein [Paludibaculum fermentans]|uniref:hypothetical protein n=1 Tax=Paludibaculum fermentans TaxID=1473598 RepID=UPI003EC07DDE
MKHGHNALRGALMTFAAAGAMVLAAGSARADVFVHYPAAAAKAVAGGGAHVVKATAHGASRMVKAVRHV